MLVLLKQSTDSIVVPHEPSHLCGGRVVRLGCSCQPFLETRADSGGPSLGIVGTRCLIGDQRDMMGDQRYLGIVDEGVVDKGQTKSAFGSIDDVACVC